MAPGSTVREIQIGAVAPTLLKRSWLPAAQPAPQPAARSVKYGRPVSGFVGVRSADVVPEAIRRRASPGRGYIAATQWHPEFHTSDSNTLDDTPILHDFLGACTAARVEVPAPGHSPFQIRDRAARLLRQALLRGH